MRRWFLSTVVGAFAGIVALLIPAVCQATLLDPSTLHIGTGIGTPCEMGCAGDPNLISGNVLDIFQQSGGAAGVSNPVLLIIGIANNGGKGPKTSLFPSTAGISATTTNGSTTTADTVSFATAGTFSTPGPGLEPVSPSTGANGLYGIFSSSSPDVYSFLGLGGANNSNNFVNWSTEDAESPPGVAASTFGIYVFAINEQSSNMMSGGGLINITFATPLPVGSYAIAYGEDSAHVYDTPFTESGLVTTSGGITTTSAVPEPASLALLGSGLLLAGIRFRRRNFSKSKV